MKRPTDVRRPASGVRRLTLLVLALASAGTARAQQWNDPRALTVIRQATDRRARQLADSGLVDYQATAHGYLTFLAQLGEGFREPPQVVKADELALQVYWRAPNLSKQRIVGRRDTTLLPTDIAYHRDHLGIVQNNFPAIIRLGDGDEVQDVPHPLSAAGLLEYDFALTDSLRISIPGRVINVYEVKVRPKDDRRPRVIGALYVDRDNAQVVRMALSFTRAAFLDKQLEDLFVVLENGLVGTQYWLPRRQEIEIRRTATWLDYPVRGIIRGRWEIGEYALNTGISISRFAGPEIVQAPIEEQRTHVWPSARILDSLPPDVRAVTAEEIRRVQIEAQTLVREQALQRARGIALAGRGISDFVRFNRVEGVSLGAGFSSRMGAGFSISGSARYGLADRQRQGRFEARWQNARGLRVRAFILDDLRDVGDVQERSRIVNSIAAQELASDYSDPYGVRGGGLALALPWRGIEWSFEAASESHFSQAIHAVPAARSFRAPVVVPDGGGRTTLAAEMPTRLTLFGVETRGRAEVRQTHKIALANAGPGGCIGCPATTSNRASLLLEFERPIGAARIVSRTIGSYTSASHALLVQDLTYLGGPISAPGYQYHALTGQAGVSQRLEVQVPVPFVGFSLGRFGRVPARAVLTPFVNGVYIRQVDAAQSISGVPAPWNSTDPLRPRPTGFYPAAGIGILAFFDLVRFDVARGLNGGRWFFYVDVNRAFWSVL